jgi:UDP-N-acetyl-D-galactosamine dehydrogenase
MIKKDIKISGSNTLILGITFKENCPDVRNTKVVDVVKALKSYGTNITIYDPWANEKEVMHEYGMMSSKRIPSTKYDAVVLTVAHDKFMNLDFSLLVKDKSVIYDVKNILSNSLVDRTL